MCPNNRDIFIKKIFSSVADHIDFLSSFFSLGLDNSWRKQLITLAEVRNEETVLDVCTGTGKVAMLLSLTVGGKGAVVGVDFCEDMLRIAKRKLNPHNANIHFVLSDARNLSIPDSSFDVVTTAFGMRNIHDTIPALNEVQRVLRPGGRFFCLELTTPRSQLFLPIYKFYVFKVIPLIGRIITKTDVPYSYLPRSIEAFSSADEFKRIIEQIGFGEVTAHPLTLGVATIYGARKLEG
jgi:demethylmenaquinone methyltransferase/2-methoxy-6-polyprenyl-1,4-benzoquinol methylase